MLQVLHFLQGVIVVRRFIPGLYSHSRRKKSLQFILIVGWVDEWRSPTPARSHTHRYVYVYILIIYIHIVTHMCIYIYMYVHIYIYIHPLIFSSLCASISGWGAWWHGQTEVRLWRHSLPGSPFLAERGGFCSSGAARNCSQIPLVKKLEFSWNKSLSLQLKNILITTWKQQQKKHTKKKKPRRLGSVIWSSHLGRR